MVDWSLDSEPRSTVALEAQQKKVNRRPRVKNSRPFRKARPLMEKSNQHLQHSGVKRKSKQKLIIRKAKRDTNGNVMTSA
jgi:hypothetical protein